MTMVSIAGWSMLLLFVVKRFSVRLTRRSFLVTCAGAAAASFAGRGTSLSHSVPEQTLADDILRPQYHLLPARSWMNDPNGPIYWHGQYHLFFQYNPNAAVWGDMHWAHAMSPDMVRWKHLPIALAPTPGGPDQSGCFSGSAVIDNDVATVLYTGVEPAASGQATLRDVNLRESQCLASSRDQELKSWQKLPKPVIAAPPPGLEVAGFRDPCLWKDGDVWYLGLGSGFYKQGGAVLLYRSSDLRAWDYLHLLCSGAWNGKATADPVDSGEMWECPDFFPLGGKHVLLYSTERKVYWEVGDYDRKQLKFYPQKQGLLDSGAYYAPKSMLDRDGNRVLWGWVPETRPVEQYKAAGWAGLMALPRVLTIGPSGELEMRVIPAAQRLRGKPQTNVSGLCFGNFSAEFSANIQPTGKPFSVRIGPEKKLYLDLRYEPTRSLLLINEQSVPLAVSLGSATPLNIFMDGSVIEIFVADRYAHTLREYSLDGNAPDTPVRVAGSLSDVRLWPIKPISNDRLTT
jgi:beta-fructofuranosidase